MTQTHKELVNKILRLPNKKLNIAMTFIDFLEQQNDTETAEKDLIEVKKLSKKPFSEMRGMFKGKIWMSDDFNEPIEEMKEYME
jgi:hypothetical protein